NSYRDPHPDEGLEERDLRGPASPWVGLAVRDRCGGVSTQGRRSLRCTARAWPRGTGAVARAERGECVERRKDRPGRGRQVRRDGDQRREAAPWKCVQG